MAGSSKYGEAHRITTGSTSAVLFITKMRLRDLTQLFRWSNHDDDDEDDDDRGRGQIVMTIPLADEDDHHCPTNQSMDNPNTPFRCPTGRELLVPLNQSLYVPGKIVDANKLLVDVGTGYFVEKSLKETKDYMERKVGWLGGVYLYCCLWR